MSGLELMDQRWTVIPLFLRVQAFRHDLYCAASLQSSGEAILVNDDLALLMSLRLPVSGIGR